MTGAAVMTDSDFERALRALVRREPFEPFEVELRGGERFVVDQPDAVALQGGAAAFIGGDGSMHFFDSENVRSLGGANGAPA
jgi:hypothetical protein